MQMNALSMLPFYVFHWHFSFCASHLSVAEHHPLQKLSVWTFSISTSLPLFPVPDILLTHNCGSLPPIAGINPHLRPPRHTVCSPTMHLSSKTFPDTFGLFSIAFTPPALLGPLSFTLPPHGSSSSSFMCCVSFLPQTL